MERLWAEAPEWAKRVEAGELSAHAAMINAGLRPYSFTVRVVNPDLVAETLRRQLPTDWLAKVAERLGTP
jgi:hypothetical protein